MPNDKVLCLEFFCDMVQMKLVCPKFIFVATQHFISGEWWTDIMFKYGEMKILATLLNILGIAQRWMCFAPWPSIQCMTLYCWKVINGSIYLSMLEIWLIPQLLQEKQDDVFHHDSILLHIHSKVTTFLNIQLPDTKPLLRVTLFLMVYMPVRIQQMWTGNRLYCAQLVQNVIFKWRLLSIVSTCPLVTLLQLWWASLWKVRESLYERDIFLWFSPTIWETTNSCCCIFSRIWWWELFFFIFLTL